MTTNAKLTMGPILFHWPAEQKRDFYFRIADEAPIDTVYIGEVVCSKRTPFFEKHYDEVAERLSKAGKTVVFSSLSELMLPRERKQVEALTARDDYEVEANDASALFHLRGRPHRIGQYFNTYNEETMAALAERGATHFALNAELPAEAIKALAEKAQELNVGVEVQVYGRTGLALSARCYHARSHERIKDNCRFVCENDPDGLVLDTLENQPFLCVNGIQVLSYKCLNLLQEIPEMLDAGVEYFRLSPHSHDMVEVANIFDQVLNGKMEAAEGLSALKALPLGDLFTNGFYHHKRGYDWQETNVA